MKMVSILRINFQEINYSSLTNQKKEVEVLRVKALKVIEDQTHSRKIEEV